MNPSLRFLHRIANPRIYLFLFLLSGLAGSLQAQTTIRYVKPAASGNGSGSSWTNASNDLQAMIDASSSGQQVWVARGTYQPATNSSFAMKDEVAIYGGFAGTEGSLTDRPVVNPNAGSPSGSVLRGNGNRVITNPSRLDRMARLDGFVITGGYALKGGGMYNSVSSPTIANCSFLNNTASKGYTFPDGKLVQGGGMYNENSSSPAIINCLFKDNTSIDGGGMYNFMSSSPRLTNCSFISNSVFTNGGALDNYNSSPTLINCSFQSNEATNGSGGGIYNTLMSRPGLTNCSFQGNVTGAAGTGGAIYNENNSGATLANGVVFGNGGANTFSSDETSAVTASYTLFELSVTGYTNGGNNRTTATSPFASSTDTRLNGCTTALNAGSDLAYLQVNGTATDLAAQPRKYNNGPGTPDRIDMGAYEYQAAPSQISVTNPAVSTATVGAVFSQSFTASGGASLYSYSVVSSSLPASLTLSRAGVLSGTPTEAGSYSVLVKTQDTYGCTATATTAYSLTVSVLPIRYVKPGGSGTGSGNSWADASSDLQSQIDLAGAQQVWVAGGTYRPNTNGSFSMKNGVGIYGGFAGTESSLSQRPIVNPTTGRPSSSTLAGNGSNLINNYSGLTRTAVLNGFVITGGKSDNDGGAIYNFNGSNPTIANCSFLNNSARNNGGGVYNNNSNPTISNCVFQGNSASQGGGLYNAGSSPTVTNCSFQGNSAGFGGGTCNRSGNAILTNCSFQGNSASVYGGGVYNFASNPVLTNCSFQGNSGNNGGGMYNDSNSDPVLTNCVVFGNGGNNTFSGAGASSVSASYSLFEALVTGYTDGGHNLTTTRSPFVSTTSTQLNGCAPAINTGSNGAYKTAGGLPTDLASQPRQYNDGTIDMGAYEYQANPTTISVSNPAVSTATVGIAFNQSFTASGGSDPYSYSIISSNQPASLSLSTEGVLSGTPTQAGSYSVLVQARDASGCVGIPVKTYVLTVSPASPIRYVKQGGMGSGNSWTDASGDLQSQINLSGAQQVWVAGGTYQPTAGGSFAMKNGVAIYGGFAGTESSLGDRPPVDPTIGQLSASVLKGNGSSIIRNPASLSLNTTARLDGFIVTGGNINSGTGGGMANDNSSPTITNCSFQSNSATNGLGTGMYNVNSSRPSLTSCLFQNNVASSGLGVGMYNDSSSPRLTNCLFLNNRSGYSSGGGMYNRNSSPVLANCSFLNNSNSTGGGMCNYDSSPTLTNCSFQGNSATSGGGIFNQNSSSSLINCSFQSNSATYCGGLYNFSSSPTLTNCSFQNNTSSYSVGKGMFNDYSSHPSLTNGVVFGNGGANALYNANGSALTASYSLFESGVTGYTDRGHNLTTTLSPFASTTSTQLNGCAPAINAGSNDAYTSANGHATDLAGNARIYPGGGQIDMGAYEYQADPTLISVTNPSVTTATVGQPFSQVFTAGGGSSPYSFSAMSSSLPASLTLSPSGVLSGTLTEVGSYSVLVQTRDFYGCVGIPVKAYVLTVSDPVVLVPILTGFAASPTAACAGSPVTFTATVGQVTGAYNYTLTNGTGTPTASFLTGTGSSTAFSQNLTAAGSGSQNFTLTVSSNGQLATATTSVLVNAVPTASLVSSGPLTCTRTSVTLTASGATGDPGSSYTFTGADGVVLPGSSNARVVSRAGSYSVTVANASGCTSSTSTSVISTTASVLVTNPPVNMATVGAAFSQSFTANGGTSPYAYSVISSNLPASLSLSTTGVLSGTPTVTGSYSVLVQASDANGCTGTDSTAYSLTVSEPVSPIRYVKQGGIGSGNSWADASGDLQSQINIEETQQVWVAAGTYQPAAGSSFVMRNAALYGGFVGNESRLDQRPAINPLANQPNAARPSGSVLRGNGNSVITRASSLLDGFVITGGSADYGGGMFNEGGSPTIANCIFQGNSAGSGGGMFNLLSSPRLINCSFLNNSANSGGGMANNSSSYPVLINCSFQGNSAGSGGGMNNYFGSGASLSNCVVFGNGGNNTFSGSYGGYVSASYSLFDASATGYADGGNNLTTTTSPFVSATDLRLNGCAPAINAGDPTSTTATSGLTDLAGQPRFFNGGRIDMGAYEYQANLTVISVSNPGVSTATAGVPFSQSFTASGGMGSYSYSVVSGNLPASLSLSPAGVLSGTPTVAGSYSVLVQAQDASGCSEVSASYTLAVSTSPIRYVKQGGSGTGSGNSWADASGDLQSQINVAGARQVWVAAGTYQPTEGGSFAMREGVAIYGGFAGTESNLDQRPSVNPIAGQPSSSTLAGNGSSVIRNPAGLTSMARLDGFLITGGDAGDNGGGMYNDYSSPTLVNCSFLRNTASYSYGGGMYNTGSHPILVNCSFRNNSASQGFGGGMFNLRSSPVMTNCSLQGNIAGSGGGMYNSEGSSLSLTNCSFQNNTASIYGGGIGNAYSSNPVLTNCSFQGNSANAGGAINNYFDSGTSLTNCVVFGNGGANTFYNEDGGSVAASYSLFDASVTGYADEGNNLITNISPFISTASAQLNSCAPAIDAGSNDAYASANGPATDLAGNARMYPGGGQIDMGAYEYQAGPTLISITTPSITTATVGQPFSQSFTASGGTAPYSFSVVSSNLPASLSLSATGVLSGTPNQTGSYSLNVQAQDASGCVGVPVKAYALMVSDATPTLIGFSASPGTVCAGSPVTFTATVGNVTGSYSYTLTNGIGTPTGSTTTGSATGNAFSQVLTVSGSASQSFTLTVSANGQSATATTPLTVNALPIPTLSAAPSATLTCAQTSLTLTADGSTGGSGSLYTFSTNVVSQSENRAVINTTGIYSVTVTNPSGCSGTSSLTIYSNTTPPAPTLLASNGGVITCALTSLALTAGGSGDTGATFAYAFAGPGVISQAGNQAIVNAGGLYSVTVTNATTGCFSTTAIGVSSATAIVSATNPAETMTTLGVPFSQPFTASGGVSPYSFSLASGSLPTGLTLSTTGVLLGSATQQGSFPINVSATDINGCTGTGVVYTLSIPTTQLTVFSRDPDNNQPNPNTIKPYLLLQNDGDSPIPYGQLTVRYWLTLENPAPLSYQINYAQLGTDKVRLTYVPLSPTRPGATGYIEFSFDASAGSLGALSNSGPIQDLINKQDYSYFNQGNDYSYVPNRDFMPNSRITAYRNGVLIYGTEPAAMPGGITPLMLTVMASPATLLTDGTITLVATVSGGTPGYNYSFSGPGTITPSGNIATVANLNAGVQTFTVTVTDTSPPVAQTATALVRVTVTSPAPVNTPPTPTANANLTATAGTNLTYTVNAFGDDQTPNSLTYTARFSPANNLTFNPANRLIQGTPASTGPTSVTITATDPGGLSASTVFTITVQPQPVVTPTTLTVLSRDPDNGQLNTNTLKPYLILDNQGSAIPYGELTLRYYLTVENPAPLRFQINYAPMGSDQVHLQYVALGGARPGATGYLEYSFDESAGSLGAGSRATLENQLNKQDYSGFYQGDDYSYVLNREYAPNPRITAYRKGVLIYGTEPPAGGRLGAEEIDASLRVTVLGNPVGERVVIRLEGAKGQSVALSLIDNAGHRVLSRSVAVTSERQEESLWLSDHPAGVYLLRAQANRQVVTLKIIKR